MSLGEAAQRAIPTIQHALARGIETLFQLETGEILAERKPDGGPAGAVLLYEAAEGGAGVLAQLANKADGMSMVARHALEVMHYDPQSVTAAGNNPEQLKTVEDADCAAGCYQCLLSYYNQPDHDDIDRRGDVALRFLLRMGNSRAESREYHSDRRQRPPADESPLIVDGVVLPMVWRTNRVVVVPERQATEHLLAALGAKGVTVFVRPADGSRMAEYEDELDALLVRNRDGSE